mgnify:CR=1 FL=1
MGKSTLVTNLASHVAVELRQPVGDDDLLDAVSEKVGDAIVADVRLTLEALLEELPESERDAPEPLPQIRVPAGFSQAALVLERVRCAACLWLIERVLARHAGVKHAVVNYATRRALVAWDPHRTSLARIIEAKTAIFVGDWTCKPKP